MKILLTIIGYIFIIITTIILIFTAHATGFALAVLLTFYTIKNKSKVEENEN